MEQQAGHSAVGVGANSTWVMLMNTMYVLVWSKIEVTPLSAVGGATVRCDRRPLHTHNCLSTRLILLFS